MIKKKKRRLFSDNPRTDGYRLRMTKDEKKLLDDVCKMTGMNKADTIRFALERLHNSGLEKSGEE